MLSRQLGFCSVAVNGEALASGLAVLVGEAGARSPASKTHRKNSHTTILLPSRYKAFHKNFVSLQSERLRPIHDILEK